MDNEQANLSARYKAKIDKAKINRNKAPVEPYKICLYDRKNTTYSYATKELQHLAYTRIKKDFPNLKKLL